MILMCLLLSALLIPAVPLIAGIYYIGISAYRNLSSVLATLLLIFISIAALSGYIEYLHYIETSIGDMIWTN